MSDKKCTRCGIFWDESELKLQKGERVCPSCLAHPSNKWWYKWVSIGLSKPWIVADHEPTVYGEPAVSPTSFHIYYTPWGMAREMMKYDWNTGTGFVYRDQIWICQTLGGNEMLVIKQDVDFESISINAMSEDEVIKYIMAFDQAKIEECRALDYGKYMRN